MNVQDRSHTLSDVEERRARVETFLKENPTMSDMEVSRQIGVHRGLVAKLRVAVLHGDALPDRRIAFIPEGKILSELCAQGVELEDEGVNQKEVVARLGLSEQTYRCGRDLILLKRNPRLPDELHARIEAAIREMDETKRIIPIHAQFIPVLDRVFGKNSGIRNWTRQEKVVGDYLHAIACFAEGAESIREMDVPYLDSDEYRIVKQGLERGYAAMREALKRLKGSE